MEIKKDKKIKLGLIIAAVVLLSLEGIIIYSETNRRLKELELNLDNLSDEIYSIHNKSVNIMYKLNMNLNNDEFKDATIAFEDNNYTSYEITNNELKYINGKEYLVFDKNAKTYLNIPDNSAISYFGKVDNEYYYFISTLIDGTTPHTEIYRIDGSLLRSYNAIYDKYDEKTKTFSFVSKINGENSTITWSPLEG